ncbi:hypothetical protein TGRUB_429240 [Toxoplasma gondii RUB]|uniref:Uncharacterized protein n=1 Tax=Toxoplasma gondii RUB TaxID=935652 RepID=A0A086M7M2_TOXGO|nr:hypothetical protein TGRUB_429240 [Toxoplasma gondii RUB]
MCFPKVCMRSPDSAFGPAIKATRDRAVCIKRNERFSKEEMHQATEATSTLPVGDNGPKRDPSRFSNEKDFGFCGRSTVYAQPAKDLGEWRRRRQGRLATTSSVPALDSAELPSLPHGQRERGEEP